MGLYGIITWCAHYTHSNATYNLPVAEAPLLCHAVRHGWIHAPESRQEPLPAKSHWITTGGLVDEGIEIYSEYQYMIHHVIIALMPSTA